MGIKGLKQGKCTIIVMPRNNRHYASRENYDSEFCRRLYPDLLPTDSPGNRITPAASTRRNLELRNTETCGKYIDAI